MSRNLKNSKYWVDLAMKLTSKDVRPPKCVRDGIVKPIEEENMKDEYIIINKTGIQQRIEMLEKEINNTLTNEQKMLWTHELNVLRILLSQSKPLIPEIEKLILMSSISDIDFIPDRVEKIKQDYISNLKLDI
jgi:ketol-acid reductoisomerase